VSTATKAAQHTPGPWITKPETAYVDSQVWADGLLIAEVNGKGLEETASNARLIAAAPELLAACERALIAIEALPPRLGEDRYEPLMQLTAAIQKARGEL
jgi:hypothetical protein